MIRNGIPVSFTPEGLTDATDMDNSFLGSCQSLQNLMFDPSNQYQVVGRPGVGSPLTTFASFTTPTFVSVHSVIGTYVYGMVATGLTAGYDEPFCYDLTTNAFIAISGITATNVPASLPTTGAWTPPAMTVVGTNIIITHTGFSGTGTNYFGVINVSNPAAPAWSSSNIATNALPSVPTNVANYNNRAYFVIGNKLYFSDVLNPLNATNADQILTVGDNTTIIGLSGLPITTQTAGVLSVLVVIKGSQTWQVSGDMATSNLAQNFISLTVGTQSARSVAQTRFGVLFLGQDGHYLVNLFGMLVPLTNGQAQIQDVRLPFMSAVVPSRVCATYCGLVYRCSLQFSIYGNSSFYDYWFDTRKMRWCGPHTFYYDCASPYGEGAILSSSLVGAALFLSNVNDTYFNTVYADNGTTMVFSMLSTALPQTGQMCVKQVIESTIQVSSKQRNTFTIDAFNEVGLNVASAQIADIYGAGLWGISIWGNFVWDTNVNMTVAVYSIPWNTPIVFNKVYITVSSSSGIDISIGRMFLRLQDTQYISEN